MANSKKAKAEREKDRRPIIERTETRGETAVEFPVWGGSFKAKGPATNRSLMLIVFAICATFALTATLCVWLVFVESSAENISSFGELIGGRKPEKRQTPDGEVIEVCPPCPSCEELGCMDYCPPCLQATPTVPAPVPMVMPFEKLEPTMMP